MKVRKIMSMMVCDSISSISRCGLLLQMLHVPWSVGHTSEPSKTAEPIEMLFWGQTCMGPGNMY